MSFLPAFLFLRYSSYSLSIGFAGAGAGVALAGADGAIGVFYTGFLTGSGGGLPLYQQSGL